MNHSVLILTVLALLLGGCEQQSPPTQQLYPWQITRLPDGGSRVFGLQLNHASLEEARQILGTRYDVGLFENPDGELSLEVFFNEVTLGGISGRFILTLQAPQDQLQAIKQRAGKGRVVDSGATRYRPAAEDRELLFAMPVTALGYIPYIDLDEAMIQQRFGAPADTIQVSEHKQHLLYPAKGLDLLLDDEGKEFLQYVAPRDFQRLKLPLLRQFDS